MSTRDLRFGLGRPTSTPTPIESLDGCIPFTGSSLDVALDGVALGDQIAHAETPGTPGEAIQQGEQSNEAEAMALPGEGVTITNV